MISEPTVWHTSPALPLLDPYSGWIQLEGGTSRCPPNRRDIARSLQENRIAELVCPVALVLEGGVDARQSGLVCECAQQLVVAGAALVRAREDGVDDSQPGRGADP